MRKALVVFLVAIPIVLASASAQVADEVGVVTGWFMRSGSSLQLNLTLATYTATATPTITTSPTATATATSSPTFTPTATASSSPTNTPTRTPSATPSPTSTYIQYPTDTPTATPTATPTWTPTSAPSGGKLFGAFDYVPGGAWDDVFTTSRLTGSAAHMELARSHGMQVLAALTGGKSGYQTNGVFDLAKWKARLDANDLGMLRQRVADGTLWGIYAVDEPHDPAGWVTGATLEAACAYAHERLPGVRCGFNTPPGWLLGQRPAGGYGSIDFVFTQSNFGRTSDWAAWAVEQRGYADQLGIGPMWLSMNIATYSPSADAIRQAGLALCDSDAAGVMMWKAGYLSETMRPAMTEISDRCR